MMLKREGERRKNEKGRKVKEETKVRLYNTISIRHGCRFVPRFQRALLKDVSRTHGENEKATVGTQRRTARERQREKDRHKESNRERDGERRRGHNGQKSEPTKLFRDFYFYHECNNV